MIYTIINCSTNIEQKFLQEVEEAIIAAPTFEQALQSVRKVCELWNNGGFYFSVLGARDKIAIGETLQEWSIMYKLR